MSHMNLEYCYFKSTVLQKVKKVKTYLHSIYVSPTKIEIYYQHETLPTPYTARLTKNNYVFHEMRMHTACN